MVKNPSAITSKINKTANEKAKATAAVTSNNKEKEKKGNDNKLTNNDNMVGRGGRGAAIAAGRGRGDGPEDATRKRKSKDSFDDEHEKNLANVYAVWNKKTDIIKPTKYWNGLLKADKAAVKPYTMDDLMGEGDDTIHNMCQIADKKKAIKTGEFHAVEFWMVLFSNAFNTKASSYNEPSSPKLRNFALRLCKTDPSEIFDEYAWNAQALKSRQDTIAWVAARKFLGDTWNSKEFDVAKEADEMEIDKDDNDKDKEIDNAKLVTPSKAVKWTEVENKQTRKEKGDNESGKQKETGSTPVVNRFFLSKAIQKTNYDSNLGNTAYTRKHKFYIKTKLPKVINKDDAEAEAEVVKAFSAMVQRFLHLDSRAVILPWNDKKHVKPLTEGKSLPKSRDQMEQYVDRVFIQHNKAAYCRMKVSFDVDKDRFFGDTDWFSGKGCWYKKDFLQVKIITCAGWFVGSVAMVGGNVKDYLQAVSQHPLLVSKDIQVEIRAHAIKIEQQEKLKTDDMVKALHVYGDYNKMATIREVMRRIYREGLTKG
jgi:hypothetical protein